MGLHWYKPDGTPCHQVLNLKQTKEQGKDVYRNTSLGDAKKLGLYPSVTGLLPTPDWVFRWRQNEFMNAVLRERPIGRTETDKTYRARINASAQKEMSKAPDMGTAVHKMIDAWFNGHHTDISCPVMKGCWSGFEQWHKLHCAEMVATEQTFCSPEWGYGGTVDLEHLNQDQNLCITDYKTKRTKAGTKIVQEINQKRQLVAYSLGLGKFETGLWSDHPLETGPDLEDDVQAVRGPILGNLYLSTTEPGRWEYLTIDPKEIPELILDVRDLVRLWKRENNF